jgi:hypothetical protein
MEERRERGADMEGRRERNGEETGKRGKGTRRGRPKIMVKMKRMRTGSGTK